MFAPPRHQPRARSNQTSPRELVQISLSRAPRQSVRNRESDQRREIPPDAWEFVDARTIRLLPGGTLFAPYKIYEVWYEATGSKMTGIGFAATRDLISFLRYEGPIVTACRTR